MGRGLAVDQGLVWHRGSRAGQQRVRRQHLGDPRANTDADARAGADGRANTAACTDAYGDARRKRRGPDASAATRPGGPMTAP